MKPPLVLILALMLWLLALWCILAGRRAHYHPMPLTGLRMAQNAKRGYLLKQPIQRHEVGNGYRGFSQRVAV